MSDHYSGHDPETGCGLLIAVALFSLAVVALIVWMRFVS